MTASAGPDEDRAFIESVAAGLIARAPAGWQSLHAEFVPLAEPPVSTVVVVLPGGGREQIAVAPEVFGPVNDDQRRCTLAGIPWRRLTIDVDSSGTLTAARDSVPIGPVRRAPGRWSVAAAVLAAVTAACLATSAVLFLTAWSWSPPPRADVIAVPPPPPRQGEAFVVVSQWFAAENTRDVAAMRRLACSQPAQSVLDWIDTIDYYGQDQGLTYPDAITQFEDDGDRIRVDVAVRIRPLDDRMKARVEDAQNSGGFLLEVVTLADEAGQLKVCDVESAP